MDSQFLQGNGRFFPSPPQPNPPPFSQSTGFNLENKVSPSILLIIIILAIIFFLSGLLHLLIRFLLTPPLQTHPQTSNNPTNFQGQLQQLFNLHDSGVDQSFIDTLPVFYYKSIIGSKSSPFDCAVCLCEFEPEDKLRLLPKCSHAFHIECIDTWLLSHSTCPLCRSSLMPDHFSTHCAPIVFVLESETEISRDEATIGPTNSIPESNSQMGIDGNGEFDEGSMEIVKSEDLNKRVMTVKLGKYKNVDACENKNVDSRRCFSMGSFEYVMEEYSSLKIAIKKPALPLTPGYRREFKIESFSVSKIWLRGKNSRELCTDLKMEMEIDEENQRRCSFDSQLNQSFAKRTLQWIMGKQNKVSNFESSSSSLSPSSSVLNV